MEKQREEEEEEAEYSVWALPPPEARDRIRKLMSGLRSEFGGPEFDPHSTLVRATWMTRESGTRNLRSASETVSPFTARIAAISDGQLIIAQTPQVMETAARYWNHFGYKPTRPYKPHMSLLYGDISEEDAIKIEKRIEELDEGIIGLTFQVSSVGLSKTDTKDESLNSWKVEEICNLK